MAPRPPSSPLAHAPQHSEWTFLTHGSSMCFSVLVRRDLAFAREAAGTWTPVDPRKFQSGSLPSDRCTGFHAAVAWCVTSGAACGPFGLGK